MCVIGFAQIGQVMARTTLSFMTIWQLPNEAPSEMLCI